MRTKTIVGLIVIAVMLSGVMVGCEQATPGEEVYTEVSVGPMTVSIPDDWEREEHAEIVEYFASALGTDLPAYMQVDMYVDESEDVALILMLMDMRGLYELNDTPWEGWDIMLEDAYMTKEYFAIILSSGFIGELQELSREVHRQVTIHGNEAWESQLTGNIEGVAARVNLLVVFAPDDMGVLAMATGEAERENFEEIWDEIRDSVELPPQS